MLLLLYLFTAAVATGVTAITAGTVDGQTQTTPITIKQKNNNNDNDNSNNNNNNTYHGVTHPT